MQPSSSASSSSGVSRLGLLIFVLILAALAFVGSQVIPFYYYYYEIVGQMESQADMAQEYNDTQIRKYLLKKIDKLEIPIDSAEALKINRFNGKITIELEYSEILYLDLADSFGDDHVYVLHQFDFHPFVESRY